MFLFIIYMSFWQILDADNGNFLKSSNGRIATRDIVQFVPMREMHGKYIFFLYSSFRIQDGAPVSIFY